MYLCLFTVGFGLTGSGLVFLGTFKFLYIYYRKHVREIVQVNWQRADWLLYVPYLIIIRENLFIFINTCICCYIYKNPKKGGKSV